MAANTPVLQVQALTFGWPGHALFNDLSFDIPPGVSLVTGDDGCGKSTLLRLMAGDLQAQAGTVSVNGSPTIETPEVLHQAVFWIDPKTEVHDDTSATDYLQSLPLRYPRFNPEALADLVDGFSLAPHLHKPLYMLSAGSKRKVWLCAAFAAGAAVTLIDHPFAALDGPSMRFLGELLQEASEHPSRAWVLADHAAPEGVPLARLIELGTRPG